MGIFDRRTNKRSTDVISEDGTYNGMNYSGLWAGAIGTTKAGSNEINKLKPTTDEALNYNAVAARCIDLIIDALSSRNLEVTTAAGEPVEHFLEKIWNESPNPSQSARLFKKNLWYRIYNHGEAIVVLDRGESRVDEPKTAHIHYGKARVRLTKKTPYAPQGEIQAFEIELKQNEWVVLAPSEVLWLREPDPKNPWKTRAPMEAALEAIGLARAAKGWQAGQLNNGANPNGIVYIGDPASDEDYALAKAEIEAALTGPSAAGRIAVTGGPIEPKWTSTSFNATEVAYLDTLKITDEQIANALGVPLDLIGGQRTYQNVEAAWRIFWEGTLLPRLAIISSEINRQILAGTGLVSRFDISDVQPLQEAQDAITERVSKAVELDIITLDEARKKLGYEAMENNLGNQTLSAYKQGLGVVEASRQQEYPVHHETRSEGHTEPLEIQAAGVRVYDVPEYIKNNAARGLRYYEEGFGGDGLTEQTIEEAKQMANGFISEDKVARMGPWIARHLVDLDAEKNNNPDNPEYPGAGLVAHLLWGSGPDKATANRVRRWAERTAAEYEKKNNGIGLHTRGLEPEEVNTLLDRLEAQTIRIVKRLAEAQRRDAKKRLQRGQRNDSIPALANSTFNAGSWFERAYEYILPALIASLDEGYTKTAIALGVTKELDIDNYITLAADERAKILVEQVNETTATLIQDRLAAAAAADRLSVDEYADILDKTFDELSTSRAETIARTEVIGSFNGAARQAALDSQVPVAREWQATNDGRTRSSHSSIDGYRTTSMADPYPNGLLYPGDPSGSPKETINCRCVELYVTDYTEQGN